MKDTWSMVGMEHGHVSSFFHLLIRIHAIETNFPPVLVVVAVVWVDCSVASHPGWAQKTIPRDSSGIPVKGSCHIPIIPPAKKKETPDHNIFRFPWVYFQTNDQCENKIQTLSIQACPKKGINPTILLWGWDWDHQSYSRERYGSLGKAKKNKRAEVWIGIIILFLGFVPF